MKKVKAMAAIMAATAVISTGVGAVPTFAADAAPSAQTVQAMKVAVNADAKVQSEVAALASEATTISKAFDWQDLTEGTISATAYKVDLESTSMANDSLDSGSSFVYDDETDSYILTIKTKSADQSFSGKVFNAKPKSAQITYNEGNEQKVVDCVVDQDANTITATIPGTASGFAKEDGTIPGNYQNMIKVKMTTTLEDNWLASLVFPPAMLSPTFYYAFNVAE